MTFIRSIQILIVIVIMCVVVAGSFALGLYYGAKSPDFIQQVQAPAPENQVQQVLEQVIEESGVINGTLVAIDGQELTIDAQMPTLNPLQAPITNRKIVKLINDTTITKRTSKPADEIQKSQEAFIQELIKSTATTTSTPSVTPPTTYTDAPATVAELTTGSMLTVNTVKEGNTYIATAIAIN
jgi:hypothetical protein